MEPVVKGIEAPQRISDIERQQERGEINKRKLEGRLLLAEQEIKEIRKVVTIAVMEEKEEMIADEKKQEKGMDKFNEEMRMFEDDML